MSSTCSYLPSRITFDIFKGNTKAYIDALYRVFCRDFVDGSLTYHGKPIEIIHKKYFEGKERSFWHMISEGGADPERDVYDVRSSYIPYAKAIIQDSSDCPDFKAWIKYHDKSKKDRQYLLCQREKYLVVLEDRTTYYKLITAFPVADYNIKKYEKEYERYKTKTPITRMDEISAPSTHG